MRRQRSARSLSLALLVSVAGWTTSRAQPDGIYEARLFAVTQFGGAGECGGSDLQYTDNNVNIIWNELRNFGYASSGWDVVLNQDVRPDYWVDRGRVSSYGRDQYWGGVDFVDVSMYSGHGTRVCDSANGVFWSGIVMGTPNTYRTAIDANGQPYIDYGSPTPGTCVPDTRSHIRLGGSSGDADIMILDACLTAQKCVWQAGGYDATFGTNSKVLLGFHGLSYDRDYYTRYRDFAYDSQFNGIGENWVDELTDLRVIADDQCATAVIFGASAAQRDAMYHNGGFKDLIDTGAHYGSTFYYWNNCDPDDGEKL